MDMQEHEGVVFMPRLSQRLHVDLTLRLVWGHGTIRQSSWVTDLGERFTTMELRTSMYFVGSQFGSRHNTSHRLPKMG